MTATGVPAAPDAATVRSGITATALGFWFVSLAPVIVASADLHGTVIATWRSWLGLLLFGGICLIRRDLTWSIIWRCGPAGLCFGASIGLFFWASQLTSIANASLLTTLQPVVLLFAGILIFGERVAVSDLGLGAVAIVGAVVIVLAGDLGGTGDLRGDILAAVSVIVGSGYFIFGKRVLETVDVVPFMVGMFCWASVLLAGIVLVSGEPIIPTAGSDWARIGAIAAGSGLGHFLLNYAQNKAPLNLMGMIQLLVPVNATVLAYLFLNQSVTLLQTLGMAAVIGALALQAANRSRADQN